MQAIHAGLRPRETGADGASAQVQILQGGETMSKTKMFVYCAVALLLFASLVLFPAVYCP